jgi:hypothetical protein
VEKDFNKLDKLTDQDVARIKPIFGQGHPSAVRTHASLFNKLMMPFQIVEQFKNSPHREQMDACLDDYASNVLEEHHASIEASFIPSLDAALKGDISFYADDQRCIPFLKYLCTQYMRTKGIKERVLAKQPFLKPIWNIMVHMHASDIGANLYRDRKRCALIIVNNSRVVPFITGDQPAINLKGLDGFSIFYPIAPHAALLMADVDEEPLFPAEGLTRDQAKTLNRMLFRASYKQVFGRSDDCLRAITTDSYEAGASAAIQPAYQLGH